LASRRAAGPRARREATPESGRTRTSSRADPSLFSGSANGPFLLQCNIDRHAIIRWLALPTAAMHRKPRRPASPRLAGQQRRTPPAAAFILPPGSARAGCGDGCHSMGGNVGHAQTCVEFFGDARIQLGGECCRQQIKSGRSTPAPWVWTGAAACASGRLDSRFRAREEFGSCRNCRSGIAHAERIPGVAGKSEEEGHIARRPGDQAEDRHATRPKIAISCAFIGGLIRPPGSLRARAERPDRSRSACARRPATPRARPHGPRSLQRRRLRSWLLPPSRINRQAPPSQSRSPNLSRRIGRKLSTNSSEPMSIREPAVGEESTSFIALARARTMSPSAHQSAYNHR
jgi:hypothetical protein